MLRKYLRKITDRILAPYLDAQGKMYMQQIPALNQATQLLLKLAYQELARSRKPLPGFGDVEFRSFSQNGEDGILLYIFSLIGTTNKKAVEIGCGNGLENNTANLIINHGWRGLLIDGDAKNIAHAKEFYAHSRDTFITPPNTLHAWVTRENINRLMTEHGMSGEIDLLSLDIDGMDYWIWEALTAVSPRVVILEYHEEFGHEPITVPYDPQFNRMKQDPRYHGASLPAFVKLAHAKGYRLVGSNLQKFNALFLRHDTGVDVFPEIPFTACMRDTDPNHYTLVNDLLKTYPLERI